MEVSGRKHGEEDDSVAGSQSFYELTCEPCNRDEGKHLKAVAYCLGCENYFCHACVKYHRRFGQKDHVLLEGDKMPKTKPPKRKETTVKKEDECTDRCEKHNGELVKYFCQDHKVVGCMDCITLDHKSCSRPQLISDISRQKEAHLLYDSFKSKLDELSTTINEISMESDKNKEDVKKQYKVALNSLRKYKSDLVEALNALEKLIEQEARMQKETDLKALDEISVSCKTLSKNISDVEAEFDALKNGNKKSQLFTLIHTARLQLEEWEKQSRSLEMKNTIQRYTFEPEYLVFDTLKNPEGLGKLIQNQDKHIQTRKTSAVSKTPRANVKQSIWQCPKCSSGRQKCELACGHELCQDCAREKLNQERPCSDCGVITGSQPQGSVDTTPYHSDFINMTFKFPDGIQESHHPLPGQKYRGKTLVCFLKNGDEGKYICKLLQIAFDRKLIGKIQDGTVCDNVGLFDRDPANFGPIEWHLWYRHYIEWKSQITKRLAALGIRA